MRLPTSPLRAFGLLEVIVVAAIVGILTAAALPLFSSARANANRAACLSNLRQIGAAMHHFANEHNHYLPATTHTTGSRRVNQSWVYTLAPYLGNDPGKLDEVRICPAEPEARRRMIRERNATSYGLNELVFDTDYNHLLRIPHPSRTLLAAVFSEKRTPSPTWDHVHSGEWRTWLQFLNDVQPDRHGPGSRPGAPPAERIHGSSNYLFADGHVENLSAAEMKRRLDAGENPAEVPL